MNNRNDMIELIYNFMNGNISKKQLESFSDDYIEILYNAAIGMSTKGWQNVIIDNIKDVNDEEVLKKIYNAVKNIINGDK